MVTIQFSSPWLFLTRMRLSENNFVSEIIIDTWDDFRAFQTVDSRFYYGHTRRLWNLYLLNARKKKQMKTMAFSVSFVPWIKIYRSKLRHTKNTPYWNYVYVTMLVDFLRLYLSILQILNVSLRLAKLNTGDGSFWQSRIFDNLEYL
jgi:hypothetical protein